MHTQKDIDIIQTKLRLGAEPYFYKIDKNLWVIDLDGEELGCLWKWYKQNGYIWKVDWKDAPEFELNWRRLSMTGPGCYYSAFQDILNQYSKYLSNTEANRSEDLLI